MSGYIFVFDEPNRAYRLLEQIEGLGRTEFTDALSVLDWKLKEKEICFISLDGITLSYLALAERGIRIATYKYRVKFQYIYSFEPISFEELTNKMKMQFHRYFIHSTYGGGGRIPSKTWEELISIIKLLRPNISERIDIYQSMLVSGNRILSNKASEILAQEKDAFGLCLDIFGIHRSKFLLDWNPLTEEDSVAPFLRGIKSSVLREDTIILHDSKIFGDWDFLNTIPILATTVFEKKNERLTICNTNRTKIENTLGVDLIYYCHTYNSFTMVQYKRMIKENNDNMRMVYRPENDNSYIKEYKRMEDFIEKYKNIDSNEENPVAFRLHKVPFYFKLCNPYVFNPISTDLISGMYLPFLYWKSLIKSDYVKGLRGGINISYETAQRWFSNSNFIELVQKGWIGSTPGISKKISELINDLLDLNHSVTIAFSS